MTWFVILSNYSVVEAKHEVIHMKFGMIRAKFFLFQVALNHLCHNKCAPTNKNKIICLCSSACCLEGFRNSKKRLAF